MYDVSIVCSVVPTSHLKIMIVNQKHGNLKLET